MTPRTVSIRWTTLHGPESPADLLDALDALPGPVLLDSAATDPHWGRFSLLAAAPRRILTAYKGQLYQNDQSLHEPGRDAFWTALDAQLRSLRLPPSRRAPCPLQDCPYLPGWIGFLGYELGRSVEDLPGQATRDTALPDLHLALYDALLVFDHVHQRWALGELLTDDVPTDRARPGEHLRELLRCARPVDLPPPPARPITPTCDFSPDDYRHAVQRCLDYIAAGDIFQVNLSQRFCLPDAPEPLAIFRRLRHRNPAWYAAYLPVKTPAGQSTLISSSPELFLRCRGREVLTRPIKGTRPRGQSTAEDAAIARELTRSEKDNAELAMIIDLLRNDLGRVCAPGSIRVERRRVLEPHPTVFHLVGEVVGSLREDVGPAGLLRATFPGGSITGAPKIRAMEIIDELEPHARGAYTGCIGWLGVDGSAEWNITIRTVVHDAGRALVQVGGGIVADSTPEGEYRETLDKARAIFDALADATNDAAPS